MWPGSAHNLGVRVSVPLATPARYTPWLTGKYSVAPGLRPLATDFGNGVHDQHLIQFDSEFARYRANKLACSQERMDKYWQAMDGAEDLQIAAYRAIEHQLLKDHSSLFWKQGNSLHCELTGDLVSADVKDPLLAISTQIQPDVAVIARRKDGSDTNALMHICAPSHWAAEDKIGRSFFESHVPVPHFEAVNAVAAKLVDTIISRGPFVRFVWGLETDDRLNHHPEPPPGEHPAPWAGREFHKGDFFVRTERQTLLGMPEHNAALFFIHVQTIPGEVILARSEWRTSLRQAVATMRSEARRYKGLEHGFLDLLRMLS